MFSETPLEIVSNQSQLPAIAERLCRAKVVGVDTESDSFYSYREKVCLIQFTDELGDIIVDPLGLDDLSPLAPMFEDPNIVKIYHGADYDVICLRRDFGFKTVNLFDTLIAAQLLGYPKVGLADLIDRHFGIRLEKKYQRHDWSRRPLLPEHLEYARGDTHWLPALREIMLRQLKKVGRVAHLEEECKLTELREWREAETDPAAFLRIKRSGDLDDEGKRILRQLYAVRDEQAKKLNRPPFKVLGDQLLLQICRAAPTTPEALDKLFPKKSALKRRYGSAILEAVEKGLDDESDIPKPKKKAKREPKYDVRLRGRSAELAMDSLKVWRKKLIDATGLPPFCVMNNSTLQIVAKGAPTTMDELYGLPDIRDWQVRDHGEALLELVKKFPKPGPSERPAGSGRRRRKKS